MKTKIKTALFTIFLLFALTTSLHAQDKYEYAIVNGSSTHLYVSTSQTNQQFSISKGDNRNIELLKKVEEMESEGWEVFNTAVTYTNSSISNHAFYLRRKK